MLSREDRKSTRLNSSYSQISYAVFCLKKKPALGFAWTLGKGNKTVIRASASLHHTSPNRTYLKLSDRTSISPAGAGLLIVHSSEPQNTKVTTLCGSVPTNPTLGCLHFSTTTVADYRAQDYLNNLPSILSERE